MIENVKVIKFSNEQIRPMSQKMRNMYYEMKAMKEDWDSDLSSLCPSDDAVIDDGRTAEGINEITGSDLYRVMELVKGYIAVMETDGALDEIHKPCVTKLEVI